MAWNSTCGSSPHACTQMSPSLRAGSRLSPLERGQVGQGGGPGRRQSEAVDPAAVEQGRSDAEREREVRGRESDGLAGVVGRRERTRSTPPTGLAGGQLLRRRRPVLEELDQVRLRRRGDVEGGEEQPVLDRRGDAGLVRAVERHRRRAAATVAPDVDRRRAPRRRDRRPPDHPRPHHRARAARDARPSRPRSAAAAGHRSLDHLCRHLRQRLGQRVDRGGQLLGVGRGQRRVEHVAVAVGVRRPCTWRASRPRRRSAGRSWPTAPCRSRRAAA